MNMKISEYAISQIAKLVSSLQTGSEWVAFFNSFGARDVYDNGLPDIGKPNGQRPSKKEYVNVRLKNINNTTSMRDAIIRMATFNEYMSVSLNEILNPERYLLSQQDGIWVVIGGVVERAEQVVNEAHFQDIQSQILNELSNAKVSIIVVVAWFTNQVLADKLKEKYTEGLSVRVAYNDDHTNRRSLADLGQIPTFPLRAQRGGMMHDKFCIIDNQRVITGSYNWSDNAEFRNDENITIQADLHCATEYSLEFRRLTGER